MKLTIGTVLLRRLITEKCGLPAEAVAKVLDAEVEVIQSLLDTGASVRVNKLGTFRKVSVKASRRRMPHTGELVDIPAKSRVAFKQAVNK